MKFKSQHSYNLYPKVNYLKKQLAYNLYTKVQYLKALKTDDPLHIFTDFSEYVKLLLDKSSDYVYSLKFSGNTRIP